MIKKIIFTILIVVFAAGTYFFLRSYNRESNTTVNNSVESSEESGERVYRSDKYKFSVEYSEGTTVREVDEGGGASTIVFENLRDSTGFQIFILPYSNTEVTPERFLLDVPSGVREDILNIELDGVLATSFRSNHLSLGDTFEIWALNNGYLYEINTLLPLKDFLNNTMKTWTFIE